jgi:hypothetical protein
MGREGDAPQSVLTFTPEVMTMVDADANGRFGQRSAPRRVLTSRQRSVSASRRR